MRRTAPRTIGATIVLALGGLAACQDDLPTTAAPFDLRPSLNVVGSQRTEPVLERTTWKPPLNAAGTVYLLPKACDVWIGETELDPTDPEAAADEPKKYPFQLVVDVATYARLKLVDPGSAEFRNAEKREVANGNAAYVSFASLAAHGITPDSIADGQFVCDPTDPVNAEYRVVDPVTDHAAKGDGPKLVTDGVTLDLGGYGIRTKQGTEGLLPTIGTVDDDRDGQPDRDPVSGAPLPGEPYDNMGVVLMGSHNTLTNSSTTVARFGGWGHALELEGDNLTIVGKLVSGDVKSGTGVFNIETHGGLGARLSTGANVIRYVKSVDTTSMEDDDDNPGAQVPVGVGFEVRRCQPGSSIMIRDSHFEGNGEAAIIRECGAGGEEDKWGGTVTFQDNFVSATQGGIGLNTREVTGDQGTPITVRNNVFDNRGSGLHGIEWTRETRGLTITGNVVRGLVAGGCHIFNEGRDTDGFPDPKVLATRNELYDAAGTRLTVVPPECAIPANSPPDGAISGSCSNLTCTFNVAASDADGIASYVVFFGDGTQTPRTPGAPAAPVVHNYTAPGIYTPSVRLFDGRGAASTIVGAAVTATRPVLGPNTPPNAAHSVACAGSCTFDASASDDPDGTIDTIEWFARVGTAPETKIGEGVSYTHTFAPGVHRTRVKVTDDRGTARFSPYQNVTAIRLRPIGSNAASTRAVLRWEGTTTNNVAIYRNGAFLRNVSAAGLTYTDANPPKRIAVTYQLCVPNRTDMCSAVVQYDGVFLP